MTQIKALLDGILAQHVEKPGFGNVMIRRPGRRFYGVADEVIWYRYLQKKINSSPASQCFRELPELRGLVTRRAFHRFQLVQTKLKASFEFLFRVRPEGDHGFCFNDAFLQSHLVANDVGKIFIF